MLTLLLIACASTPASSTADATPQQSAENSTLATWENGSLSVSDLDDEVTRQLKQMEAEYLLKRYQTELQIAENYGIEKVAETTGQDLQQLIIQEITTKVTPPTDAEVQAFYVENTARMGGRSFEETAESIGAFLQDERSKVVVDQWLTEFKAKHNFKVSVPFPDLPRFEVSVDDDPSMGPEDAEITLIEFGEYECPFCVRAKVVTDQLMKNYEGKIRRVYRDFPLGFHQRAIPAAVAANCAGAQDKYFPMHDLILGDQSNLSDEAFKGYAEQLKLDIAAWETCLQDPAQVAEIRADMADGEKVGVSGTPGFFINGIFLSGALPYETFEAIIERELAKK